MYTVVLMAALSAGNSAPDHWFRNCHSGCNTNNYGCSCSCHGAYGRGNSGIPGSYGGYMHVTGNFCTGFYSQGWSGCTGAWNCYSPYGDYAGHSYYQPFGCHGGYGCYAGLSCYGVPLPHHGWIPEPGRMEIVPTPEPKREVTPPPTPKKKAEDKMSSISTRARVVVDLPEDARLFIDGQLMKTPSAQRTFQTPDLKDGQAYFYDLKVELDRDGQTVTQSRRVVLRPGAVVNASFAEMDVRATAVER